MGVFEGLRDLEPLRDFEPLPLRRDVLDGLRLPDLDRAERAVEEIKFLSSVFNDSDYETYQTHFLNDMSRLHCGNAICFHVNCEILILIDLCEITLFN
jgi:hypothetical protein